MAAVDSEQEEVVVQGLERDRFSMLLLVAALVWLTRACKGMHRVPGAELG